MLMKSNRSATESVFFLRGDYTWEYVPGLIRP